MKGEDIKYSPRTDRENMTLQGIFSEKEEEVKKIWHRLLSPLLRLRTGPITRHPSLLGCQQSNLKSLHFLSPFSEDIIETQCLLHMGKTSTLLFL